MPDKFRFTDKYAAVCVSFLRVAVWWVVFAFPLFRWVKEPRAVSIEKMVNLVRAGFKRLGETFQYIKRHKELRKLLLAFWLYKDGIGKIIN